MAEEIASSIRRTPTVFVTDAAEESSRVADTLRSAGSVDKLAGALTEHFGKTVRVETEIGAVEQTANAKAVADREARQRERDRQLRPERQRERDRRERVAPRLRGRSAGTPTGDLGSQRAAGTPGRAQRLLRGAALRAPGRVSGKHMSLTAWA